MAEQTDSNNITGADKNAAVIFVYQQVNENDSPSTNIRLEQFQSHIRELERGKYNVLPLDKIVAALKTKERLPEKTVAITFDGGYSSVLKYAVPVLLDKKLPFTVFVATDHLDSNTERFINWDELKKLDKKFGLFTLLGLVWIFAYSLTDASLLDERAFLIMVVNLAVLFAWPWRGTHSHHV